MSGLLLRLAGPLQSWGERSAFASVRDTALFPTRSALVGMFAAAEGIGRDEGGLDRYQDLRFTVRVDRPGIRLVDYHTVGGGFPKNRTAATSGGSNKGAAVITRRHYLSDAVFVVAVTTTDDTTVERLANALSRPHWAPYLGRRSCVPDEPFLLRRHVDDPVEELRTRVPLSRTAPQARDGDGQGAGTIAVEFLWEQPPSPGGSAEPEPVDVIEVNDMPTTFAQHGRSHTGRRLHRTRVLVPRSLVGPSETLTQRLIDYAAHIEESA